MEIRRHVEIDAPAESVFALLDDLSVFPSWMALVHDVAVADGATSATPAWDVELRAQVGPVARSKRLRMQRTVHEPARHVVFERAEIDGRAHSPWVLDIGVESPTGAGAPVDVTMTLVYGGSLWSGAVLQRVLDEHVERGAAALRSLAMAP